MDILALEAFKVNPDAQIRHVLFNVTRTVDVVFIRLWTKEYSAVHACEFVMCVKGILKTVIGLAASVVPIWEHLRQSYYALCE